MCYALSSVLCTMFMIMILLRCLGRIGGGRNIPFSAVIGLPVLYVVLLCPSLVLVLAIHVLVSLVFLTVAVLRSLLVFCRFSSLAVCLCS